MFVMYCTDICYRICYILWLMISISFIRCRTEEIVIINQIVKVCNRFLCTYFMEYFVYFDYYFFRSASPPCKKNNAMYHANVPSTLVLHIQWNIVIALSTLLIYFMECYIASNLQLKRFLCQDFCNLMYIIMF